MPCRDWRNDQETQHDVYSAEIRAKNEIIQEYTPLLCEACSLLEEAGVLNKASSSLREWYKAHEKCEEDRVRYEAALKLSERERRLLGINLEQLAAKVKKK